MVAELGEASCSWPARLIQPVHEPVVRPSFQNLTRRRTLRLRPVTACTSLPRGKWVCGRGTFIRSRTSRRPLEVLLAVRDGELDTLSFLKGSLSVHLNSAVTDEDVDGRATVGGIDRDESVPLFSIEPFDCASPARVSLPVNLFSASIGCAYVGGLSEQVCGAAGPILDNRQQCVVGRAQYVVECFVGVLARFGHRAVAVTASEPCGVKRVRTACRRAASICPRSRPSSSSGVRSTLLTVAFFGQR